MTQLPGESWMVMRGVVTAHTHALAPQNGLPYLPVSCAMAALAIPTLIAVARSATMIFLSTVSSVS
jgi:hypothetical protein